MNFGKPHISVLGQFTLSTSLVVSALVASGCSFIDVQDSGFQTAKRSNSECEILKVDEKPNGNELDIRVDRISDSEFVIRVKNQSDRNVFLAYEPREKNLLHFFSYTTQKRNQYGEYVTVSEGGDYAPGLQPLRSGEETSFTFLDIEKGDYKLKFMYLVDEKLVEILNDPNCMFKFSKEDKLLIKEANTTVFTPVLHISKSVGKSKR